MNELDIRKEEQLMSAFEQADRFVMKNYLNELATYEVVPASEELKQLSVKDIIRLYQMTKIVYDKNENMIDKLSSVYHALAGNNSSLIMVIHSDGNQTEFYIGTKTEPIAGAAAASQNTLKKSFSGNFPGSELVNLENRDIESLLKDVFDSELDYSMNAISTVSGVAALRNDEKEQFVQGAEKLIDAMKGDAFTALYIADSVTQAQINEIRIGYEQLYTQLVPFASSDLNFSANESESVSQGMTKGFTEGINQSVTRTQSHTENNSKTESNSTNYGRNIITTFKNTIFGGNTGHSESVSMNTGYSKSASEADMTGNSWTDSTQESKTDTATEGSSRSLQIKFENKSVQGLLAKIDEQLLRLQKGEDFGMWNCAAYFIADNTQTTKIAANTYKSLMRGTNSSVESACVNTWDNRNKANLMGVMEYVKKMHHPVFNLGQHNKQQAIPYVTPASLISGVELAIHAGLPLKSVSGLPVMESAEFGRNIVSYDAGGQGKRVLELGRIFHMGKIEDTPARIDVDSLSMHTFITGSTGAGKSNALCQILDQLDRQQVRFLVIEPAKGEYKHIFGGRKDVHVLGTNPQYTKLLQLNPFIFPRGIHVLEHIDRMVEIFNACWPMYAAMPAVLKEAMERVYEESGWDLIESINYNKSLIFPTFQQLLSILPEVIKSSEYSQEVQSNYTGALVTRVRSLTNGLYGSIFTREETDNTILFDKNCIIDLSRIGSSETKALIMGVLVMRLQEHRMSNAEGMNNSLKHVTVLEEAHNLLRRTSQEQSQEGSNLQGKAVEMLANAIAEMRTYGEGFIIADQSPNLLDLSVIRNTNTKIILRLPEESDRQLVGRASNLNEEQIVELAKLKVGVAAVYQNNWLQPVLCEMEKFTKVHSYHHELAVINSEKHHNRMMLGDLTKLLLAARISDEPKVEADATRLDALEAWIHKQSLPVIIKHAIQKNLQDFKSTGSMKCWEQDDFAEVSQIIARLYNSQRILLSAVHAEDLDEWNSRIKSQIRVQADMGHEASIENAVIQCLLREKTIDDGQFQDFYFSWVETMTGRGIS